MAENTGEKSAEDGASKALIASVRRIFRPLVRLLIARSLPFPLVSNLLRGVYVDVAVKEFPLGAKPQSDSRITLLTGVHRKDVKRLRHERHRSSGAPRGASLGSQLIARWTSLPEYLDADGTPRPLPRLTAAGSPAARASNQPQSFESLVRSVNTDIRPRVVLDEWQRLGIAHVDEADRVCLDARAFIPREGSEEMAYFFGRNLHDHAAAAVHNVLGEGEPFLERGVSYNNLSAPAVSELTELARRRAMEFLQEVNARALTLQRRDSGHPEASNRFNFGIYVFSEDQSPARDRERGEDEEDEK